MTSWKDFWSGVGAASTILGLILILVAMKPATTIIPDTQPKGYQSISTALNEHGELIILEKTPEGYKPSLVLSDSATIGAFSLISRSLFVQTNAKQ